jgi:cold shock CspA family protein
MPNDDNTLPAGQIAAARHRRPEAVHMQAIEGSPLDEGQVVMFEMFEREGYSHERCLVDIRKRASQGDKK